MTIISYKINVKFGGVVGGVVMNGLYRTIGRVLAVQYSDAPKHVHTYTRLVE